MRQQTPDVAVVPRLAASNYLNAAPVVYAFLHGSQKDRCTLVSDPAPSVCARMLANGDVDAALIPAIEYQRIPGLAVARGVCIAARRLVRSVLLISKRPIDQIESVALDDQSRTSAALVRILLGKYFNLEPVYTQALPDLPAMLATNDAALMIGDPAMTADKRGCYVYDLARLWRDRTGLPFVFALWAVWPDRMRDAQVDFEGGRREGVAASARIVEGYAGALGLDRGELVEYLTDNIHYDLDAESLAGLALYYSLAAERGLIDAPVPLAFWP